MPVLSRLPRPTDGAKTMTLNVLVEADAIQAEGFDECRCCLGCI